MLTVLASHNLILPHPKTDSQESRAMPTKTKTTAKTTAASRSGNPAKRAEAAQVSDISAFKQRAKGMTLQLPTGLVVKARRVELATFVKEGAVPNPLMQIVSESLDKGQALDVEKTMT